MQREPTHGRRVVPFMRPIPSWIALLVLALLQPSPAVSATASDSTLAGIRKGFPITILRADGTQVKATFLGMATNPPRLLLAEPHTRSWGGTRRYELSIAEIRSVEGKIAPTAKPRRILVGAMVGMVAGGILGAATPLDRGGTRPASPDWNAFPYGDGRITNIADGAAAGSILGALIGLLATPSRGAARRWTFPSAPGGASFAPPDSAQVPIR